MACGAHLHARNGPPFTFGPSSRRVARARGRAGPRPQAHVRAQTSSSLATLLGEQGRTDLFYASRGMSPVNRPVYQRNRNLLRETCLSPLRVPARHKKPETQPHRHRTQQIRLRHIMKISLSSNAHLCSRAMGQEHESLKSETRPVPGPDAAGSGRALPLALCSQLRLCNRSANANGGGKAIAPFALICPGAERFVVGWCGVLGSWVGGGST